MSIGWRKFGKAGAILGLLLCLHLPQTQAAEVTPLSKLKPMENVFVQSADPQAVFVKGSYGGVRQRLWDNGAIGADVQQLLYKQKENYYYGTVVDIQLGSTLLSTLTGENYERESWGKAPTAVAIKAEAKVADVLNKGAFTLLEEYRVISPFSLGKDGVYRGLLRVSTYYKDVVYTEEVYGVIYYTPYYGPSLRLLAVADYDDAVMQPLVQYYLK